MLYHLLLDLQDHFSWLNVIKYITFRGIISLLFSLTISLLLYPWFIREIAKKQLGQVIRDDGPKSHYSKSGTPTMGGLLLVLSVAATSLLWMRWDNPSLWLCLALLLGYSFWDSRTTMKKSRKIMQKAFLQNRRCFGKQLLQL